MRKHPVIYGFCLIFLLGLGSIILLYGFNALTGDAKLFNSPEKVGIVSIRGVISSSQEAVEQLDEFGKDSNIKAVVVRIDSPGGGVAASQEIYAAVKRIRKNKIVVASLGSVAASGGYMVACAANKIVANPGTVTGSISAIMYFANAEDLLKKIGLKPSVIKSGKYKDIGSPTRGMSDEEKQILQVLVDDIYFQFIDVIAQDRKIPLEEVKKIADGRVFSGRQALQQKLVDFLGDKSFALQLAGKMAGIKGTPDFVYPKKKDVTFWDFILQSTAASFATALKNNVPTMPQGLNLIYEYGL
ncbi:MAG: signal peptide peptidase SppA [Deltaproteobacteria bacterium]|nr:signal peptide peptidase SppA [Deltaproteobacteria bacterium]